MRELALFNLGVDSKPRGCDLVGHFNPVVRLISGLRWAFNGATDVHIAVSTRMTLAFMTACLAVV